MQPAAESAGPYAPGPEQAPDKPGIPAHTPADQVFQDNGEPFRSLFAASLDAVLLTAPDGRILAANEAACRMFGYAEQELIAAGRSLVVESSDPRLAVALEERVRTGRFRGELTFVRKDGTKFPGEISSAIFSDREGRRFTSTVIRDVTERKRAEKALQESEERFRLLGEAAFEAIAVHREGVLLFANGQFLTMFGYELDELRGKQVIPLTVAPEAREFLGKQIATGGLGPYRSTGLRKDGTKLPIEIRVRLMEYEGRTVRVAAIMDITERKRAEAAIETRQRRFRALIEHSMDAIALLDSQGTVLHFPHPATARILGYDDRELLGRSIFELIHADDRRRISGLFTQLLETPGSQVTSQFRFLHKNGSWPWLEATGTNLLAEPSVQAVVINYADVTERRQTEAALAESEQKFRTIFDSASDGMFLLDLATRRIVMCNAACSQMLGYTQEELRNLDTQDLHPPEDLPFILEQIGKFAKGEAGDREDIRFRRKDGTIIFTDLSPTLMTLAGRRAVLVVFKDITERKQAEAALRQSQEQLRALSARREQLREEERTRISREIHDQLGQSLTALKMDLRAIERRLPAPGQDPVRAELAERLTAAVRLSDDLIERMHDLAAELRPGLLDNIGLVAAVQEEARRFQARTGIACAVGVAEPFPPLDAPTSTALYRILQETLANVARHAQAASVEIRLAEAEGAILLEVRDDGKGISEAALAAPKSLGLLGMRERAAALGGSVHVSGEPGRGTTVRVRVGKGAEGAEGLKSGISRPAG